MMKVLLLLTCFNPTLSGLDNKDYKIRSESFKKIRNDYIYSIIDLYIYKINSSDANTIDLCDKLIEQKKERFKSLIAKGILDYFTNCTPEPAVAGTPEWNLYKLKQDRLHSNQKLRNILAHDFTSIAKEIFKEAFNRNIISEGELTWLLNISDYGWYYTELDRLWYKAYQTKHVITMDTFK